MEISPARIGTEVVEAPRFWCEAVLVVTTTESKGMVGEPGLSEQHPTESEHMVAWSVARVRRALRSR